MFETFVIITMRGGSTGKYIGQNFSNDFHVMGMIGCVIKKYNIPIASYCKHYLSSENQKLVLVYSEGRYEIKCDYSKTNH